jgi:hypothetical protein
MGGPDDDEEGVARRGGRGPSRFGMPDEPGLPRRNSRAREILKNSQAAHTTLFILPSSLGLHELPCRLDPALVPSC